MEASNESSAPRPRARKRGRKPKCPIKSISEIRERFKNNGNKIVFQSYDKNNPNDRVEKDNDRNETQIPFGNLNITVHEAPKIDVEEIRQRFNKNKSKKIISESKKEIKQENKKKIDHLSMKNKISANKQRQKYTKISNKKKQIYNILASVTEEISETKKWPDKTDILCWWCSHSFDTIPIPGVHGYNEFTKTFKLRGIFCSWECAAAHTFKETNSLARLYQLFRLWTKNKEAIIPAPPKIVLKSFGGYMDIEEFRNGKNREIIISTIHNISYENNKIMEITDVDIPFED